MVDVCSTSIASTTVLLRLHNRFRDIYTPNARLNLFANHIHLYAYHRPSAPLRPHPYYHYIFKSHDAAHAYCVTVMTETDAEVVVTVVIVGVGHALQEARKV